MDHNSRLYDKLTILFCSCDKYEELWIPFFKLFKKYWKAPNVEIIFNTESKNFVFDGLEIKCVHSSNEYKYGKRMLNALSHVKTEYVLPLLDDFFLRKPVNENDILRIINWMDQDKKIVYFNCEATKTYCDFEIDRYTGYKRLPPANDFTYNMQAAIWRTKNLKEAWRPEIDPWEWEKICNVLTTKHPEYKYYCTTSFSNAFMDYGHYEIGDIWGVCQGKWVIEDVEPFFKKENINVDFSNLGIFDKSKMKPYITKRVLTRSERYKEIVKYMGIFELPKYFMFGISCRLKRYIGKCCNDDYFEYLKEKTKNNFLKKHNS